MNLINYFGNIKPSELAKELVKFPELHALQVKALKEASKIKILNPEINLKDSLEILHKANLIARTGKVFAFNYESGYLNRTEGHWEIYQFYRLIDNELFDISEINYDYPDLESGLKRLKSQDINEIFTGEILEKGYCGLEKEWTDFDGDRYWHRSLERYVINRFEKEGIKVINLGILEDSH